MAEHLALPGFQVRSGDQALEALDESLFTLLSRVVAAVTQGYCVLKTTLMENIDNFSYNNG